MASIFLSDGRKISNFSLEGAGITLFDRLIFIETVESASEIINSIFKSSLLVDILFDEISKLVDSA